MRKLFSRTNCIILALAILVQSLGQPLMGQSLKSWHTSTPTTTSSSNSTTTILLAVSGVLVLTALVIVIVVVAKKNKMKKKMATGYNMQNNDNLFIYNKYSIPEFNERTNPSFNFTKNTITEPFLIDINSRNFTTVDLTTNTMNNGVFPKIELSDKTPLTFKPYKHLIKKPF